MPRVRPLSPSHDPAPRRVTLHLIDCNCPACDRDYHRKAAIETVAMFAIGFVTAWLTDWALGGPGLQIMIGL